MAEPVDDAAKGAKKPNRFLRIFTRLVDPKEYAVISAEARRGLKDLQDAVLVAFPDSAKSRDEPGTIANPTQQLVTQQITGRETGSPLKKLSLDDLRAEGMAKKEGEQVKENIKDREREK